MSAALSETTRTVFTGVTALAAACGVHKSYISKVLHGAVAPSPALSRRLAAAGVSLPRAARPARRGRRRASVEVRGKGGR